MFIAAPEWQAGDWYADRNAAWTEPFVEQITIFPNAAHDDMCDMMTIQLLSGLRLTCPVSHSDFRIRTGIPWLLALFANVVFVLPLRIMEPHLQGKQLAARGDTI
jgi:hypothetical protein